MKPTVMNGRLTMSGGISGQDELPVEPDVGREMQARIGEGPEPEHPPQSDTSQCQPREPSLAAARRRA